MMKNELEILLGRFRPEGPQEEADLPLFKSRASDAKNLTRDALAHFTASAFVLNQTHERVLGIYHKIYKSWGWMGGHADGDVNLLHVAEKEVREESGIEQLKLLLPDPISIENLPVFGHFHRSRGYVSAHLHLNVTFLFEADDQQLLRENKEETGGVAWIPLEEFSSQSSEEEMKIIYDKIISRIIEKKKEDKL
ncbi:NUDIX hydrolase [Lactococcus taiwanensis]|uniref:NUDIX hydrolase n=1 Tax=Lactococcus taiwanensis TaxID=1151742 RepID=UPI0023F417BB|nr:NUDIX hydrolase [Lactococcus taiwanensis]